MKCQITSLVIISSILVLFVAGSAASTRSVSSYPTINGTNILNSKVLESVQEPTKLKSTYSHRGVQTTVFWVGESASKDNDYISNSPSAWDEHWKVHFGGSDSPTNRRVFLPADFYPLENPFYIALPYNDMTESGRKATASVCKQYAVQTNQKYSWCKNSWLKIEHNNSIVYAQWEDVGPNEEDDPAYVFGITHQKNTFDEKAGLDVSPAVRDFLKLGDSGLTNWTFVQAKDVPEGPWKLVITSSLGTRL